MKRQSRSTAKTPHPENPGAWWKQALIPRRTSLLVSLRLAVGLVANITVVLWSVPKLAGSKWSALDLLHIAIPLFAIIILISVICLGRDVARLLAIGLCVLPVYIFLHICMAIIELWLK